MRARKLMLAQKQREELIQQTEPAEEKAFSEEEDSESEEAPREAKRRKLGDMLFASEEA